MTRVFKPTSIEDQQAFLASHCDRCTRCLDKACGILADATIHQDSDPDFPAEWIRDDLGEPTCTAFDPRHPSIEAVAPDKAPEVRQPDAVMACADTGKIEVDRVETTLIGRGLIEVGRLKGKRAWSIPYAAVADLFEEPDAARLHNDLHVPLPVRARVHHAKAHVTITAKSSQDGASVSSSVKLRIRRSA